jgi:hypothetical protein
VKTVPSDSHIPPSPVTTSNNSFSVLTIEEPGVEEDTVEVEGEGARTPSEFEESEGAVSPSDSKRRGKKPWKPEREKAEWCRLPHVEAHTRLQPGRGPKNERRVKSSPCGLARPGHRK